MINAPWGSQKLAYQCQRLKQTSSTPLRSVPPATARPFAAAPETFPVIAATAKEKSWFNSHRGRAPHVTVQVRGEHWVGLNIVRFVPEEVGKIQRSSQHTPRIEVARMTKEERAVKPKRRIWKFSWAVVGLLVVILAGALMAFMTCRRRTPFQEPQATSGKKSIPASPDGF